MRSFYTIPKVDLDLNIHLAEIIGDSDTRNCGTPRQHIYLILKFNLDERDADMADLGKVEFIGTEAEGCSGDYGRVAEVI